MIPPSSRIVVTGAAGQLGSAMVSMLADRYAVVPLTRAEVDLRDGAALRDHVIAERPAVIINCASLNTVDNAEDDAEHAFAVNALAVRALARAAEAADAILVHFSSDFVFDGVTDRPYTEEDAPSPQGIYAQSKLVGEWMATAAPRHYILRVESLFGGPRAKSSVDLIVNAVRAGREARIFYDREVSPSLVDDVVTATIAVLDRQPPSGLYHCVNSGHANWLDVARHIAHLLGRSDAQFVKVALDDAKLRVRRPKYAALSNAKLTRFAYEMPHWQDALERYLARI